MLPAQPLTKPHAERPSCPHGAKSINSGSEEPLFKIVKWIINKLSIGHYRLKAQGEGYFFGR